VQAAEAGLDWNDPAAHTAHLEALELAAYVPAAQFVQTAEPGADAYAPAAQAEHAVAEEVALKEPTAHGVHADALAGE